MPHLSFTRICSGSFVAVHTSTLSLLIFNYQSQNVQLSTSYFESVVFGPNRVLSTQIETVVVTITPAANPSATPLPSGNITASGNSTLTHSGNSTASASSTTTSSNLPTAPTNVNGGGDGPNGGAPSPGAKGAGGVYGPDDGYIAAANALKRNALLVSVAGVVVGGALVLV